MCRSGARGTRLHGCSDTFERKRCRCVFGARPNGRPYREETEEEGSERIGFRRSCRACYAGWGASSLRDAAGPRVKAGGAAAGRTCGTGTASSGDAAYDALLSSAYGPSALRIPNASHLAASLRLASLRLVGLRLGASAWPDRLRGEPAEPPGAA